MKAILTALIICVFLIAAASAAQDFAGENTHGQAPLIVSFTGISNTTNVTDYQWSYLRVQPPASTWTTFSSGTKDATFTFTEAGTYYIMFTEFSQDYPQGYISTTKQNFVYVFPLPTPVPTIQPTPKPTPEPLPTVNGIAVFRPASGNWYFDYNMDGSVDKSLHFGTRGDIASTSDVNGDGVFDLIVFRPSSGNWYIDTNRDGNADTSFHFGTAGDVPFVGVWK